MIGVQLAGLDRVQPPEVAELVRPHQDLAGTRTVAHVVLLVLALAEQRRQFPGLAVVVVDLLVGAAQCLDQQPAGIAAVIGDPPQPAVLEQRLALAARDVVAIQRVRRGLLVVAAEVQRLRIVGDVLELGLDLGRVLDEAQRAAVDRQQVEPGVLVATDVAADHEERVIGGDRDRLRAILAAGQLDRKLHRAVLAPDLGHAGEPTDEDLAIALRGREPGRRIAHVEHRLDPPRQAVLERGRGVASDVRRRQTVCAEPRIAARLVGLPGRRRLRGVGERHRGGERCQRERQRKRSRPPGNEPSHHAAERSPGRHGATSGLREQQRASRRLRRRHTRAGAPAGHRERRPAVRSASRRRRGPRRVHRRARNRRSWRRRDRGRASRCRADRSE